MSEAERLPSFPDEMIDVDAERFRAARLLHLDLLSWATMQPNGPEQRKFLGILGAFQRDLLILEQYFIRKA